MGMIKDGVYYNSHGEPSHRGVVEVDNKLYYAGKNGVIVKDRKKTIHHGMANGLLKHGKYYFDSEGVCDQKSFHRTKSSHSKEKKKKPSMKKQKKIAIISAVFVIAFSVFTVLLITDLSESNNTPAQSAVESDEQFAVDTANYMDEVYLCSDGLKKFYQGKYTLEEAMNHSKKAYQPFVFSYTVSGAESASLLLSENDDYSSGTPYTLDVTKNSIVIDNLKTGTTYYYLMTASDSEGKQLTKSGSFTTAESNRFITLSGVYNTRDIGGCDTLYGKKVKQNVLIRGTEIDGLVESGYYLDDVAEAEPFHFVYDFDLRSSEVFDTTYVSRLGENVGHMFYNSPMYGNVFSEEYKDNLKNIFTDLAEPSNYPMYMHCTYGIDRTGTIIYLLQGLLGVSEDDMMTEYNLSGFFYHGSVEGGNIQSVYSGLQGLPGENINDKIEIFLIDTIGITEEQIQSIREIFLG